MGTKTKSGHELFLELHHLNGFLKDMGFDTMNLTLNEFYTIKNQFLHLTKEITKQEQGHILDPFDSPKLTP